MRFRLILMILSAWLFLAATPAWAIVFTFQKQRFVGSVMNEDGNQITVRIKLLNGKDKEQLFDRSKIDIVHEVDRKLLAKLTKDNPKAYRDYADKLAKEKADPEAVELALRLYVIAAHLDTPNLGSDCLLSMSTLALANPEDARKYRALAYLLDPKSDKALLKLEAGKVVAGALTPEQKALMEFEKMLRLYRSGHVSFIKTAIKSANDKANVDLLSKAPGKLSQRAFISACEDAQCKKCNEGKSICTVCKGNLKFIDPSSGSPFCSNCNKKGFKNCTSCDGKGINPYPEDYVKAIVRAEVWALDQIPSHEPAAKSSTAGSWSRAVNSEKMSPVPLLRLETITEHDPHKCVYRNGAWVAP